MDPEDSSSHANEDIIGSVTSSDEIIAALAKRGCEDLTTRVDPAACSEFPYAGGGFCDVYRGRLYNGTMIAIKSLRVYDGPEADSQRRKILKHAARELYHWSKLQHCNVLPLLGLMLFRNSICMVSEWMENGTLMSFLERKPEANRARLCMDVCEGLCYIHEQGMIHGDLKAANVMVSSHGVAMVTDFGNARLKDLTLKFSNTKGHSISLRWTAPELLDGSSQASKEADVYALGMTVLEVVTGKPPFSKIDDVRVLMLVGSKRQHPPRPEAGFRDDLWELLKGCWAGDPAKRPSVKGVNDQLRNLYPGCEARQSGSDPELVFYPDTPRKIPTRTRTRPSDAARAEKASRLVNLGISHMTRFQRLGDPEDLNKAIQCQNQLVLLTLDSHADKPSLLNNLATSYLDRFKLFEKLEDLETAIACLMQAISLTQDEYSDKSNLLINLGTSCLRRFEYVGELSDIDEAIISFSDALLLVPEGHAKKLDLLINLGASYHYRFKNVGELEDVKQAIECQTQAVLLTRENDPDMPNRLRELGNSYMSQFERFGKLADVDQAIECLTKAMQLNPTGHTDTPVLLNSLGGSYTRRFERLGELADLEKAIDCLTQAVSLTSGDHPDEPSQLSSLGNAYMDQFRLLGELANLDKAIEYHAKAVQLTPDGHADKSHRLNNLGISYIRRFERLGELTDVERAIGYLIQAMQLTPDGHPDKPSWLNNLGISYTRRFDRLGELTDIDRAIRCQAEAVQLTPDGHPDQPSRLLNLGMSYFHRFQSRNEIPDLERAQSTFQHAALHVITNSRYQFQSARHWARCSILLQVSPQSAYMRCIELVPHLMWLGTTITERNALRKEIDELTREAVAWAISVQLYDLAIEWFEEGRTINLNHILQLRTPLDDLAAANPQLAQELKDIAARLEAVDSQTALTASSSDASPNLEQDAQHHRRLATKWEQLLRQVRSIPGFDYFMRPRKATELKLAAHNGPVVLINSHSTRCDALIIFPLCDDIAHLSLENIPPSALVEARAQLSSLVGHPDDLARGLKLTHSTPDPEHSFKVMLATLWSGVVEPVLDTLARMNKLPGDELPHVTWCTTGALSLLPLHAAGCYDGSKSNAFDRAISSYTPTLGALLAHNNQVPNMDSGVVAVGQVDTKGLSPLPNSVHELSAIQAHAQTIRFLRLDDQNATVDAVLNAMEEHASVHLACHATQNPTNPAHSAFHLYDGNLTLEAIIRCSFKNKGLAFLSACQTATRDEKLPDEAVHLAAGMLMAGYPSVITTMWSIYDEDAPEVAGEVYAELLKDGKMDYRGAAKALHKAVASLREKVGHEAFERWVPFIHIGV